MRINTCFGRFEAPAVVFRSSDMTLSSSSIHCEVLSAWQIVLLVAMLCMKPSVAQLTCCSFSRDAPGRWESGNHHKWWIYMKNWNTSCDAKSFSRRSLLLHNAKLKVHPHAMSALAVFFHLCHQVLKVLTSSMNTSTYCYGTHFWCLTQTHTLCVNKALQCKIHFSKANHFRIFWRDLEVLFSDFVQLNILYQPSQGNFKRGGIYIKFCCTYLILD